MGSRRSPPSVVNQIPAQRTEPVSIHKKRLHVTLNVYFLNLGRNKSHPSMTARLVIKHHF